MRETENRVDESLTDTSPDSGSRAALSPVVWGVGLGIGTAVAAVCAAGWWVWTVLEGVRAPASTSTGQEVVMAFAQFLESAGAPRELTSPRSVRPARASRPPDAEPENPPIGIEPAKTGDASLPPSLAALSPESPLRRWLSLSATGGADSDGSTRAQIIEDAAAGGDSTVQDLATGLSEVGEDAWQERAALLDLAASIAKTEGGQQTLGPSLGKVLAQEVQRAPSSQNTEAARDHVARVARIFFELNRSEQERAQFVMEGLKAQTRPEIRAVLEAYAPKVEPGGSHANEPEGQAREPASSEATLPTD